MLNGEYVIQELIMEDNPDEGWCLFRPAFADTEEAAIECLSKLQNEYPDKTLRLHYLKAEDCWWNDPFLAN